MGLIHVRVFDLQGIVERINQHGERELVDAEAGRRAILSGG
jgi:hypothetical protein